MVISKWNLFVCVPNKLLMRIHFEKFSNWCSNFSHRWLNTILKTDLILKQLSSFEKCTILLPMIRSFSCMLPLSSTWYSRGIKFCPTMPPRFPLRPSLVMIENFIEFLSRFFIANNSVVPKSLAIVYETAFFGSRDY